MTTRFDISNIWNLLASTLICRVFITFVFGAVIVLVSNAPVAVAEVVIASSPTPAFQILAGKKRIVLKRLAPVPPRTGQLLINGVPVDPKIFPGVLRMTTGGTCTASIVGPAAVLLAAHCVDHLARITFVFDSDKEVDAICEHAPGYNRGTNDSEDWALCIMEFEVSGFPYETINVGPVPPVGTRIILSGYGCSFQGGSAGPILRLGVSKASEKAPDLPAETSTLYTKSDIAAGEAVLCPGDSGGPAWVIPGDRVSSRSIVGVNSRTTFQYGFFLFAATGSSAGKAFFTAWAARHGQEICGINRTDNCL